MFSSHIYGKVDSEKSKLKKSACIFSDWHYLIYMKNEMKYTKTQKVTEKKLNELFDYLEKELGVPSDKREYIPDILMRVDDKGIFNEAKAEYFLQGNCGIGLKLKIDQYSCWVSNYTELSTKEYDHKIALCNVFIKNLVERID